MAGGQPSRDDDVSYLFGSQASQGTHPLRPYVDWGGVKGGQGVEEVLGGSSASGTTATAMAGNTGQPLLGQLPPSWTSRGLEGNGSSPQPLLSGGSLGQDGERTIRLLKTFSLGLGLRFFTSALAQPFEVGKILAQVQWVPGDGVEGGYGDRGAVKEEEEEEEEEGEKPGYTIDDDISDEDEAAAYFQDLEAKPRTSRQTGASRAASRQDESGYLVRASVYDESTRPDWVMAIPDGGRVGVWESMRALCGMPTEGITSLWKGQLASFIYDVLNQSLVPMVESSLNALFYLPDPLLIPLQHLERPLPNFMTLVAASTLVGCLLSPLDLVRTRLIVQSRRPDRTTGGTRRKYTGPIMGLGTVLREEGGLLALIFSPLRLFPTVLCHAATSATSSSIPLLIERRWRMNKSVVPIQYGLVELLLNTAQMILVLPTETILRRLQVQGPVRRQLLQTDDEADTAVRYKTCIEVRPRPYTGLWNALTSIFMEEGRRPGSRENRTVDKRKKSSLGFRGLYRGFAIGLSANVMVFVLGLITRDQEGSGQWEEI